MSLAIGHFAAGAALTTLVLWVVRPGMAGNRSITLFGGGWAMVPDAGKIERFATPEMLAFHDSPAANVFWGHRHLDVVDVSDSPEFAAAAVAAYLLVSVLAEASAARRTSDAVPVVEAGAGRLARHATARSVVWLRRLVAVVAVGAGGALGLLPLTAESSFVGIFAGTGAILGLLGLEVLDEDAALAGLARRTVPRPIRVSVRVGVGIVAGSFAVVLLSRVPTTTDLSVPYGALGFVLVVLVLRLWLPSRTWVDSHPRSTPGDRAG